MYAKKNVSLLIKVLILLIFLSLTGCQSTETLSEPEGLPDVDSDIQEEEAAIPEEEEAVEEVTENILLTLLFLAGDYIISPDGNFLYFTVPSAPGTLYHVVDLSAVEIGSETVPEIEWEAMEPLLTPSIMGTTYHLQITGDSSNLLYATSEDQWNETDYGNKTVIYFSRPEFPPGVYHQLELTGDEVPGPFSISNIKPVWDPGTNNIFYLTLSGVYRYSTDDRKKTLIRPADELPGLPGEGQMVPHAFFLQGNNKEMAYYYDGAIYLVSLIDRGLKPETIKVDSGPNGIQALQYIFDGSYLVLESGYTDWDYWLDEVLLTFVDRQSGEVLLEGNSYLPAGYILDDRGQMFFKSRGPGYEGYFVLLDSNLSEKSRVSAEGIFPADMFFSYASVIKFGDRWALPFYQGMDMDTHFAEISFD